MVMQNRMLTSAHRTARIEISIAVLSSKAGMDSIRKNSFVTPK